MSVPCTPQSAVLRRMRERDAGTIVHVGSTLTCRGIPLQTAYCGAKHALQGFHESLRCGLLHDQSNLKVTMVQLPAVNTPQFWWVLNGWGYRWNVCREAIKASRARSDWRRHAPMVA
jgi:short-subunit dehydrogenase